MKIGKVFEIIHDSWIHSEAWKVKECKPITEYEDEVTIDTILVTDGCYFYRIGLIAFYIEGCKYPQYIHIPFSVGIEPPPVGTLLSRKEIEELKVLTLEKYGECIYRLTFNN